MLNSIKLVGDKMNLKGIEDAIKKIYGDSWGPAESCLYYRVPEVNQLKGVVKTNITKKVNGFTLG